MAKKIKSANFVWEGTNRKGLPVKGEIVGQNAAMVKAQLRKQGVNPQKVKKAPQPLFGLGGGGATASADLYQMGSFGIYGGGPVEAVSSHVLKVAARFEVYL